MSEGRTHAKRVGNRGQSLCCVLAVAVSIFATEIVAGEVELCMGISGAASDINGLPYSHSERAPPSATP